MVPFLYFALKSLYRSGGATLKKIIWCDDDAIKPYFIAAGKALKYGNLRWQLSDSLENKPFPSLPEELQKNTYFEFGSIEDHFKYRDSVMKAYPFRCLRGTIICSIRSVIRKSLQRCSARLSGRTGCLR